MTKSAHIQLLVFDGPNLGTHLDRTAFKNFGVNLQKVENFRSVQAVLNRGEHIDAILINIDGLGEDSVNLIKGIKSSSVTAHLPLIVTSVRSDQKLLKETTSAGADLFIEQPVPRDYFVGKLKDLLAKSNRLDDRVPVLAKLSFYWQDEKHECNILNLSTTGLLAEIDLDIAEDTKLDLSFTFSGYKRPVKARGTVVRKVLRPHNSDKVSLGIRFDEIHGEGRNRIIKFIEKSDYYNRKLTYYL